MRDGNHTAVWLGAVTFAWLMLFVWQGLDFTDMGFWLTGYQQLYAHPDRSLTTVCWLSSFIGHWVGIVFGGSVIAYRLGYVVVVTISAITAYWILASRLGHSRTLAAMVLLTVGFTRVTGCNWIGYNDLTALFYLAGAALLYLGLTANRRRLVVLAGVVLGANTFIRFPNVLGLTLVAAIWLQAWAGRWTLRKVGAESAWFLGGFLSGLTLILGLVILHGHATLYLQAIQGLFGVAVDGSSHHPGSGLLKGFIYDHVQAFVEALSVLTVWGWIANWVSKQKRLWATCALAASVLPLFFIIYFRHHWLWCITGICYAVLLMIVVLNLRRDKPLALLAFIAAMVLFLAPLGSNLGMANAIFGMWLALPLTLAWLWQSAGRALQVQFNARGDGFEADGLFTMGPRGFRVLAMTFVLALLLQSLASAWRQTFRDSQNRLSMTHSVAHPLLRGTYTTAARAKAVTELLAAMSHFTRPGDEVLAYNGMPLTYFLTQTHSWIGVSWPDFDDAEGIAVLLRKKELSGARLPCIVRASRTTYGECWPTGSQALETWWHQDEPRRVFGEFERRNGYAVAWSNGFFEVLTTPTDATAGKERRRPIP